MNKKEWLKIVDIIKKYNSFACNRDYYVEFNNLRIGEFAFTNDDTYKLVVMYDVNNDYIDGLDEDETICDKIKYSEAIELINKIKIYNLVEINNYPKINSDSVIYLINTTKNHNKFYIIRKNNRICDVEYGGLGKASRYSSFSIDDFDKTYNSKIKDGYKEVSEDTFHELHNW